MRVPNHERTFSTANATREHWFAITAIPMRQSLVTRFAIALLLITTFPVGARGAERPASFKSTDRGRSWARSDAGMPGDCRVNAFGLSSDSLFAGTDSGIFISSDEGKSWQPSSGADASSGRVFCFAALGEKVYAGTHRSGILTSSNRGVTWAENTVFPSRKVRCLLAHEGKIYAGTDADGVFVSGDDGRIWTRLSLGLPRQAQVFALSAVKGRVFAGLYSKGLYAWNETDRRWNQVENVSPLVLASIGDTLVVGHNPGGIYWSDNLGATWSRGESSSVGKLAPLSEEQSGELSSAAPVWELASGDDIVFAGASTGIYYSEDQGRIWVRARRGLPVQSPGVSFLVKGGIVLAGTLIKDSNGEADGAAKGSTPDRSGQNRTSPAGDARR